jgi:flagellar basal-body rod modification protein FlgD
MFDPIASTSAANAGSKGPITQGNPTLGKEEFLTLLVAQLKNQDPLNPTNPEQMAAQLAQFSSLEQLIEVNARLDAQASANAALAGAMNNTSAMGLLGKTVLASGDQVQITGAVGDKITVGVGGVGGDATLRIYDANGTQVASQSVGPVTGGRQDIDLGAIGQGLAPGTYRYELAVTDAQGAAVQVQTFMHARIDSVRFGPSGPVLVSGGVDIPLSNVVQIDR